MYIYYGSLLIKKVSLSY